MSRRHRLGRVLLGAALLAIIAAVVLFREDIDAPAIAAWLTRLGPWAPLGFIALYAVGAVAFVPGFVLGLLGGALFGPLWGSLCNLLGAKLGAALAFLIARYLVAGWIERRARGWLKRVMD